LESIKDDRKNTASIEEAFLVRIDILIEQEFSVKDKTQRFLEIFGV